MKFFVFIVGLIGLAPLSLAAPAKSTFKGLHTGDRIFLPLDSSQDANFLLQKSVKKQAIDAPLVTIEQVADADKKERKIKIKSQLDVENSDKNPE